MAVTPEERERLTQALGRRGMSQHVRLLRREAWPEDHVLEWLRYLKIPPHENDYPVLPRGVACPRCGSKSADRTATGTYVPVVFPGGWAERCMGCGATWLHAEHI